MTSRATLRGAQRAIHAGYGPSEHCLNRPLLRHWDRRSSTGAVLAPAMGRSGMFGAKAWVISYFEDVNRST